MVADVVERGRCEEASLPQLGQRRLHVERVPAGQPHHLLVARHLGGASGGGGEGGSEGGGERGGGEGGGEGGSEVGGGEGGGEGGGGEGVVEEVVERVVARVCEGGGGTQSSGVPTSRASILVTVSTGSVSFLMSSASASAPATIDVRPSSTHGLGRAAQESRRFSTAWSPKLRGCASPPPLPVSGGGGGCNTVW